ncbi:MAG: AMP-binding protein [Anaerolineales bacterium]|nr:AMP-binding protein [Chloroflexota bacterium]MBL6983354.1 AMP-binding protein [Anaerolineales bacterium]
MHAADLLSKRADLTPDRVALVELETGRRFTYAELNKRANRLANFMHTKLGVGLGDRVSILAKNSITYIDLFYGLPKIGAIFAPFNWRLTANELAFMVNDLEPKVLICEPEHVSKLEEMQAQIQVKNIVTLRGAEFEGAIALEEHLEKASSAEPQQPELDGESPYCILYTSGTTGYPKGAVIPHRQILYNCLNTVASWGLSEYDISPVYTPLFHAGGLFAFLTPLLYLGGRIILARNFDPAKSMRWILEEGCTVILGVPTLFQMWIDSDYFDEANFDHVHFFISGGAPCPPKLMNAWRKKKGIIFRQGYGLTEVGANCFSMTDEDSVPKSGSVGKPIFHSKMRIVDPETGQETPVGKAGELLIWGPHVCSGYWRNPEATAESIKAGWFYTGDMAHKDADGFYYIDGRYKDMIKSGGENVYAAEVEAVYKKHSAVKDAVLIGKVHEKWGEVGLMIMIIEDGKQVTEEELKNFALQSLAKFKIPKEVVFANDLPYTAYGKVEKAKLREKYL